MSALPDLIAGLAAILVAVLMFGAVFGIFYRIFRDFYRTSTSLVRDVRGAFHKEESA